MARILVAGGLWEADPAVQLRDARVCFASALGREIVARGHVLLGGCRTQLDAKVANAAAKQAAAQNIDRRKVIRSRVIKSTEPAHTLGEIVRYKWAIGAIVPGGVVFPEPIQAAES